MLKDNHLIDLITDRAWQFVENNDLVHSYNNFLDIAPECILDEKSDGYSEFESISLQDYQDLIKLYETWPTCLNNILDMLSYVMSINLYSITGEYSYDTLKYVNKIIDIIIDNNMILPDTNRFLITPFSANRGWGNVIDRNKF